MAAARISRVVHAETTNDEEIKSNRAKAEQAKWLPNSERDLLRHLWRIIPERVGLASNLGGIIATLERHSHGPVVRVPAKPAKRPTLNADSWDDPTLIPKLVAEDAESTGQREVNPSVNMTMAERAAVAEMEYLAGLPSHVAASLAPAELPDVRMRPKRPRGVGRGRYAWWNPKDGLHGDWRPGDTKAAKNCRPPTMDVKSGDGGGFLRMVHIDEDTMLGPVTGLVSDLFPVEQEAENSNRGHSHIIRSCRRALRKMADDGDGDLVTALYLVFGGVSPRAEDGGDFRNELGPQHKELAPLVCDTATVLDHAAVMTKRLRASLTGRSWEPKGQWEAARCGARRESVSPYEAAVDLLVPRHGEGPERYANRTAATNAVRRECEQLIIAASMAYMAAREATG